MAKQGAPGEKQFDPMLMLAFGIMLFFMIWVLWFRFHTPLATFYSWVRIVEFGALWLMGEAVSVLSTPFHAWVTFFLQSDKSLIEWRHLTASSFLANLIILFGAVIPISYRMAKRSLKTNPYNHLNYGKFKDYTLHSFTDTMATVYPHLKLFRQINLTARPINSGKYRMSDTEKQFAIKLGLLDQGKPKEFKVNRDRAAAVFRAQLGRPWTGFESLTRSELAVIAALIPRIAATDVGMPEAEYKAALECTKQLIRGYWKCAADSYDPEKDTLSVDLEAAKKSIRKYRNHPHVRRLIDGHAYVATVIYRMMHECRVLGVLQPAEFRWLRVTDRRLWLCVDNVGRIVSSTEVSGVYAHFLHEMRQQRAIERPQVDNAVDALQEAIAAVAFTETEVGQIAEWVKQAEAAKAAIDVDAVTKKAQNVFLALGDVGGQLVEASVVAEDGNPIFWSRCRIDSVLTAGDQARLGLSELAAKKLRNDPVSAEALRKRLLDVCNGHRVHFFGQNAVQVVPGLDRAAYSVVDLRERLQTIGKTDGESVEQAMQALGLHVDVSKSDKWSVTECLRMRSIWTELEKMKIQKERPGAAGVGGGLQC